MAFNRRALLCSDLKDEGATNNNRFLCSGVHLVDFRTRWFDDDKQVDAGPPCRCQFTRINADVLSFNSCGRSSLGSMWLTRRAVSVGRPTTTYRFVCWLLFVVSRDVRILGRAGTLKWKPAVPVATQPPAWVTRYGPWPQLELSDTK